MTTPIHTPPQARWTRRPTPVFADSCWVFTTRWVSASPCRRRWPQPKPARVEEAHPRANCSPYLGGQCTLFGCVITLRRRSWQGDVSDAFFPSFQKRARGRITLEPDSTSDLACVEPVVGQSTLCMVLPSVCAADSDGLSHCVLVPSARRHPAHRHEPYPRPSKYKKNHAVLRHASKYDPK